MADSVKIVEEAVKEVISSKDWWLVMIGFILGILASLIASWVNSFFETILGFRTVKLLSMLQSKLNFSGKIEGEWEQFWHFEGSHNFPPDNESFLSVYQFNKYICAEAKSTTHKKTAYQYRVFAKYEGDFITGVWYDPRGASSYHGAFQLRFAGNLEKAEGLWVGFSTSKAIINQGKYIWQKKV
jgi:hypothetical protein